MKQSLALRVGQTLTMTPALQQAIRLLQLSSLDLQTEIQQALDSNLMLELAEEESPVATVEEALQTETPVPAPAGDGGAAATKAEERPIADPPPDDGGWDDVYDGVSQRDPEAEAGFRDYREASLTGAAGLHEHLLWQASLCSFDATDAEIAAHLVDAVNDDGYLEDWPGLCARLRETLGADLDRIGRVLDIVQDFDPPGVAARDLSECLRLQLLQFDEALPERALALEIVDHHMGLLARHDLAALARAASRDEAQVRRAAALIQSLQPHPGRPYQPHEADYVVPEVLVAKKNGRWRVSLNPDIAPRLRINRRYLGYIRRADTSRDQQTLKQHLQEARYFINSLKSRNETLLKVAERIVEEQRAFLEYGEEAMRPLVLRAVAEQLGIHESTVSRATANKYMLTPRGLYELKFFFSSHVKTVEGGTCSATAIQAMLKRLIAQEPAGQPLSDALLSGMLLKQGIQVARRTVAKYREALGIPPAHERKRLA